MALDVALLAIGGVVGLMILMLLAAAWSDFAVWAIDAAFDAWKRVH